MNDTQLLAALAPVVIVNLMLVVVALAACCRAEATRGPKWVWALVILFVNVLGPILFFAFGRRSS